ncbi:Glycosyltransferase involved in cell wall bisynthesis [Desulfacinum hydrothermale DSM 13146]|uniref:Glycosyltransferase involved in cell wall bisynthesis n=1 Tax=Desulfacinum hydrothermale DSM 13146 TaxID=1121390 RepID=A0A1W1XS22_9BACT|nr:glycosyltransferase [Desulfacinum hydrothermale]SMC26341.1 Glycosyltransferase involved in cell wall bisynthesis [Desulfacinum hydrothermale DSM 13146]
MGRSATTPPRVSVIMPCYNAASYLRQALESVTGQTHGAVELIVVDDGSTDESRDILAQYPRVKVLRQDRQGPYPARNLGLKVATGEYVAFLDADDYWAPTFLEEMLAALQGTDAALAYCGWQNVGAVRSSGEPYVPPDYEKEGKVHAFLRSASPWPIHAALIRKEALDAVGGFSTALRTCMDYDLWLRIGLSHPIVRVPRVLAYYRHHGAGQLTDKQGRQAINVWLVKKRFMESRPDLCAAVPRDLLKRYLHGALLARGYRCYWQRDLAGAQTVFRFVLRHGSWGVRDVKYLFPALLPMGMYAPLLKFLDRRHTSRARA